VTVKLVVITALSPEESTLPRHMGLVPSGLAHLVGFWHWLNSWTWYRAKKRKPFEFNSCIYKRTGWKVGCRFVAMRIPKELNTPPGARVQCELFEDDQYTYRIFCTNLRGKPHKVITFTPSFKLSCWPITYGGISK